MQLETPHLVGRRCIGRTLEPGGEPLAARNVAALSVRVELACSHVLDHALTQRADSLVSLMESSILSEVDDTSILRTRLPSPLWPSSQLATGIMRLAQDEVGRRGAEVIDWLDRFVLTYDIPREKARDLYEDILSWWYIPPAVSVNDYARQVLKAREKVVVLADRANGPGGAPVVMTDEQALARRFVDILV